MKTVCLLLLILGVLHYSPAEGQSTAENSSEGDEGGSDLALEPWVIALICFIGVCIIIICGVAWKISDNKKQERKRKEEEAYRAATEKGTQVTQAMVIATTEAKDISTQIRFLDMMLEMGTPQVGTQVRQADIIADTKWSPDDNMNGPKELTGAPTSTISHENEIEATTTNDSKSLESQAGGTPNEDIPPPPLTDMASSETPDNPRNSMADLPPPPPLTETAPLPPPGETAPLPSPPTEAAPPPPPAEDAPPPPEEPQSPITSEEIVLNELEKLVAQESENSKGVDNPSFVDEEIEEIEGVQTTSL